MVPSVPLLACFAFALAAQAPTELWSVFDPGSMPFSDLGAAIVVLGG